jgi:hypothetical protein
MLSDRREEKLCQHVKQKYKKMLNDEVDDEVDDERNP